MIAILILILILIYYLVEIQYYIYNLHRFSLKISLFLMLRVYTHGMDIHRYLDYYYLVGKRVSQLFPFLNFKFTFSILILLTNLIVFSCHMCIMYMYRIQRLDGINFILCSDFYVLYVFYEV